MPLNMIETMTGKYFRKLEELIVPLNRYGITYFCWQTVSNEGKWSIVSNRPDWLEYSAGNHFYFHDPSLIHPKFHRNSTLYTATYNDESFQKTIIQDAASNFDLNYGLSIIEKTSQGAEFSIFAAANKNSQVINTYINYLPLLKKFIHYFKQEMSTVIQEMQDVNVDIASLKQDLFYNDTNIVNLVEDPLIDAELSSPHVRITKREKECLYYTLRGMTAKEIARTLQISHRTVEIHLDHLRKKYDLSSKRLFFSILPT